MRASAPVLATLLLAAWPFTAAGAPPDPLDQALKALDTGSFQQANSSLEEELAAARMRRDRGREAMLLFYLGLARQQEAAQTGGGSRDKLQEAAGFYNQALILRRELGQPTGPILNNLGLTYVAMGAPEDLALGEELLRQAVASGGKGGSVFAANYAEVLEEQSETAKAARFYRLAAESEPDNLDAHWNAVRLLQQELVPYLRCRLASGQVDLAQETALRLLVEGRGTASDRPRLLAIAVEALARRFGDPRESPGIKSLDQLRNDPDLGPGIAELQQVLAGDFEAPPCCSWWTGRGRDIPEMAEAFQDLLLALGRRSPPDLAERYFLLALDIGGPERAAKAFLEIAELYFGTRQMEKLDRLARQYTPGLLDAKMASYREASWREAYELHRALGVAYARLGRWGDSSQLDSAIFQLEHARTAAKTYNLELQSTPPATCGASLELQQPITVEPGLIALLAEGYEKTGRPDDAARARLDSAEGYVRLGDVKTARAVLEPLITRYETLSAEDQKRFQAVRR